MAGATAEITVISVPTTRPTITVRRVTTSPVAGMIEAERCEPGLEHHGEPDPGEHARHRRDHADDQGLAEDRGHDLPAARADRPQQG